jgi:deoxyadenosine/deoxycytidine kinase
VEGPPGAGKTALAVSLAERVEGRPVLEKPEENPFLSLFHRDMEKWAFQTQVSFLIQRHSRLEELHTADLFNGPAVSDFCFHRDGIFARATLSERDLVLYRKLSDALAPQVPEPDLVVYLQASSGFLKERMVRFGRPFERDVSRSWVERLVDSFNSFFLRERRMPTLVVNAERIMGMNGAADALLDAIGKHRGGLESFSPGSERLF